ncbi:gephyrin-like molybdotransferase Glp [Xylanimonas sp. McL0601]|uniref:molybdopterin molybdotransferase MoeA n=1 Tax=Xylanimonas sp. McL0601 TaxID=3414739 RepID=UPI003CF39E55
MRSSRPAAPLGEQDKGLPQGPGPQGPNAQGPNAQGPNAQGPNAQGLNTQGRPQRVGVAEHAARVAALVAPALADRPGRQVVVAELLAAAGAAGALPPRRLAADARAAVALPGFDNSQMDGYAVRSTDLAAASAQAPVRLPVGVPVPAGTVPPPLADGTAVPVMTGAPVPAGADAVVRVEDADPPRFGLAEVRFAAPVAPGTYVRTAGSDVAAGDVVVPAGAALGPAQLGALAAAGVGQVEVARAPRVLLVSTGSELAPAGAALGPAQVHDANGAALAAALAQAGARVVASVVPDEPDALLAVLAAASDVDLVLTSGGVSAGAYEVVRQTLADAWFGSVAVQPGGPQGCGTVRVGSGTQERRVPLVAFPGNPVSALVSFELFLRPVLAAAAGAVPARRPVRRAPLGEPLDSPPALLQVRRGTIGDDGRVRLVGGPGSHLLAHLAAATVLVHVPPGVARLEAGDAVDCWEIA